LKQPATPANTLSPVCISAVSAPSIIPRSAPPLQLVGPVLKQTGYTLTRSTEQAEANPQAQGQTKRVLRPFYYHQPIPPQRDSSPPESSAQISFNGHHLQLPSNSQQNSTHASLLLLQSALQLPRSQSNQFNNRAVQSLVGLAEPQKIINCSTYHQASLDTRV
jgi:hypothetical protein